MDPDSLRCFLAAADALHFSVAARRLGRSPAALGKRIAGLEATLGVPLFARTTRRVELTPAGAALVAPARAAVHAADACARAVRGDAPPVAQTLLLGTRVELGRSYLLPLLPALEAAQPGLRLDLFVSSGPDLERLVRVGELDAAISSRPVGDPAIQGHRLHEEGYALVGAAELLRGRPVRDLDDLAEHTLLDISAEHDLWRYWRDAQPRDVEVWWSGARYLGTVALVVDAVRAGWGLAVLPTYAIGDELAAGRLVAPWPDRPTRRDWFRLIHRRGDPRGALWRTLLGVLRAAPLR